MPILQMHVQESESSVIVTEITHKMSLPFQTLLYSHCATVDKS